MKNNAKNSRDRILWLCRAGIIAALYVALTYLAMLLGLDKNAIQIRFSEALCVLAFLSPAAIPGLTVGCFLANLLTGCAPLDIALGPVATLIGALGAYLLSKLKNQKRGMWLCSLPNIIANTITVPFVIYLCYTPANERSLSVIPFFALTVLIGELISCALIGTALLFSSGKILKKIL